MTGQAALEAHYAAACAGRTAIAAHLPRLRALADGCRLVIEFGVKRAASSAALLLGAEAVISYDLVETREARALAAAVPWWTYVLGDSRTAPITACDLLFIDSLHTFTQLDAELRRHADAVTRTLVCHDTITFGSVGAAGETGDVLWRHVPGQAPPAHALGLRPALDALLILDETWRIAAHYLDSHGLLVLERRA